MKPFLAFLLLALCSFKVEAVVEPYLFFSEEEQETINGPRNNMQPEYYSDIRTFQEPYDLYSEFLQADDAFHLRVGSLNSKRFLNHKKLKFTRDLNDRLTFSLFIAEQDNFEERRQNFLFGLGYRLNNWLKLNAYGSLFFEKNKNDLGFSLDVTKFENHILKLFLNFPDYQFTQRNTVQAKDLKQPLTYGLYGTYYYNNEQGFIEYFIHQQNEVKRLYNNQSKLYTFKEFRVGLKLRHSLNENWFLNFSAEWIDSKEGQTFSNTDSEETSTVWSRDSIKFNIQLDSKAWVLGLESNYRYWVNQNNQPVMHRNLLPYIWRKVHSKSFNGYYLSSIDLGLDTLTHWSRGSLSLRDSFDQRDRALESRLNLRFNFDLSKNTRLLLTATGDLDDPSWEGGGGQFQMIF